MFKNPIVIAIVLILVVIAAAMIGSSQWLRNLLNPASKPKTGDPCVFATIPPTAGIIDANGACIADPGHAGGGTGGGGTGDGIASERTVAPQTISVMKTMRASLPFRTFPQYPGVNYKLVLSGRRNDFYQKVA